ncbi:MAG: xanthine dehydrogenase family protein molybdopterin-binding subunit [Rhodobacteraceae bacterium]|nr:xanthine dehydrogenase family protein molybdopterin-binding subunit [Paracoccaceae bacterium]
MSTTMRDRLVGRSVTRIEDRALLTGKGRYLDDIRIDGCLSAHFLRSPHAHASFTRVDAGAARAMPGVVAIFTMADLRPHLTTDVLAVGLPSTAINLEVDRPILARDEVAYVGEAVAMIVAETRAQAEDAGDAIDVDYTLLAAVSDCRDALKPEAPPVHRRLPHNCLARFAFRYGDVGSAFAAAAHVVSGAYHVHRGGSHSMEGRGVLAAPDPMARTLRVWSSTQTAPALKRNLCVLLGKEEDAIVVETPDIGGGFGPKLVTYPEEIATALGAILLGRPVKWVEDRREHFVSTTQERDQHWDVAMALDGDGRILGIRGDLLHDHGAYTARGLNVPYGSGVTLPLPYNVPAYSLNIAVALTNKVPVTPVRGAGQPQGAFVMERLMDKAARALAMEPQAIRELNLVRASQMPCRKPIRLRGGTEVILDSGDYVACMRSALERAGHAGFAALKRAARRQGRRIGIGLANYVEGTGRGPYETVSVRISRTGRVVVSTAAVAMGQGTATMIAQIVGDQLGGRMDNIVVRTGDTGSGLGFGGFNSRQTVVAGASAHKAAVEVRRKLLQVASHLLEVAEGDLDVVGDRVEIAGAPRSGLSFADIANASAGLPGFLLPGVDTPGLASTQQVNINDMAFANGTGVAEVEVDEETGRVRVVRFTLAHDCGRIVNPATVDGQILGGIAHGLGNTLFEEMLFDDAAQPLSTTLADYLLVTASEIPAIDILHRESPSPLNALGVKGIGESGVFPVMPAVAAAIDDALSDLGVHVERMPISPQALRARIIAARSSGNA